MGKKTEEDFRAKLEKSKGKKHNRTKILFIIIVIIVIGVISWFVTTTKQKDSKEATPTAEPVSITIGEVNGIRFEVPGNCREIAQEDTTIDEVAQEIPTFDAKEFFNPESSITYKVFVGYPDEIPTDSFSFDDLSDYLVRVRNEGWVIADEEQVQYGTHLTATKETNKEVVSDFYVLNLGTDEDSDKVLIQTYHDVRYKGINVTQSGLQRTSFFNEGEDGVKYTKLDKRIDWVSALREVLNNGKNLKQVVGLQDIEVDNWIVGSTIYDEAGVQIKLTGLYLDRDNDNYAVALEVQNDSVEESEGFKGYRIGTALQMGVGDEDPLWLDTGYNDDIVDIRNITVEKGKVVKGYAFFDRPSNADDYNKYVLRYYKFNKAGSTDINKVDYVDGTGTLGDEIPFVSKK